MNGATVRRHRIRGEQRTRGLIHERHKFIRKSRHGASNANPTHVWTTTQAAHPSALSHVALHHRSPTTQLDDALNRAIFRGEFRLLIVTAAVAPYVHALAKGPGGAKCSARRHSRSA